jgi:23S rRNA (uridine2552-2'-O)-methyltransferase
MYQPKDHYFRKARQEGYPARSVYKLQQIDRRYSLVKPGRRILDLGCCPGSWLKYCAENAGRHGLVIGIDKKGLALNLPPNTHFIQADINQLPIERVKALTDGVDLILSDLAPATTGIKLVDEQASLALAETVVNLGQRLLYPGGDLLIKIFQGEDLSRLLAKIKQEFGKTRLIRPQATRKGSREVYILGLGKLGKQD